MAASNKGTPPPPHAAAAAAAAASMYPSLMMYDARSSNISASASSHSTPDSIPSGTVATSTSAMRGTTLVPIPLETMSSSPFTFHTTATTAASTATGYSFAPPDMTTSTTGIIPTTTTTATGSTTTTLHRRQKRLERNRESAKLSRRRRKQYLEVLEHKVTQLSLEMDLGRRDHVKNAVNTLKSKRHDALTLGGTNAQVLSRASTELRVAATFQMQQQFSLALPLHSKFLLWLTLQNEPFFKSGRATSERLSAARIGERVRCIYCLNLSNVLPYSLVHSPLVTTNYLLRCSLGALTLSHPRMGCGHYFAMKLDCHTIKKKRYECFKKHSCPHQNHGSIVDMLQLPLVDSYEIHMTVAKL